VLDRFLQDAESEYMTLVNASEERIRKALERTYSRWLYDGVCKQKPPALGALEDCRGNLLRLALYKKWSFEDAEELSQEVMLRVAQQCNQVKSPVSFLGWVFRVSRTVARERIIADERERESLEKLISEYEINYYAPDAFTTKIESLVSGQQLLTLIREIVQNDKGFYALIRIQFYGYTTKEVAIELNTNPAYVRALKNRAINSIKRYLNSHPDIHQQFKDLASGI
jgi:RNA polymerase sigma factor (sigma-70 family)